MKGLTLSNAFSPIYWLALLSVLLVSCFATTSTTNAYTSNPSICSLSGMNWQDKFNEIKGHQPTGTDDFIVMNNGIETNLILFIPSPGGDYGTIESGGNTTIYLAGTNYIWNGSSWSSQSFNSPVASPSCISYANNLQNYGGQPSTLEEYNGEPVNYDLNYHSTTSLSYGNNGWLPHYTACSDTFVDTDWSNVMKTAINSSTDLTTEQKAAKINSFDNAIENGRWGVSQILEGYQDGGNFRQYNSYGVYWTEDPSLTMYWDNPAFNMVEAIGTGLQSAKIMNKNAHTTGTDCSPKYTGEWDIISTNGNIYDGNNYLEVFNFFFNGTQNLPAGYAGEPIRESNTLQQQWRPQYKYCIENRQLIITDKSTTAPTDTTHTLKATVSQGTFETQTYFHEAIIAKDGVSEPIPLYGQDALTIQVSFVYGDGGPMVDSAEIDYIESVVTISDTTLDACATTVGAECDIDNLCNPATSTPKYIDCTQYNFNIKFWDTGVEWSIPSPQTIGCAVNQTWLRIWDILSFILAPNYDPLENPFGDYTTDTHGLTGIVTAPLIIFTNMSENNYYCQSVVLPLPNAGNITLPCMTNFYQSSLGSFFTLYQTIVSGILSYYILVNMLRTMKDSKDLQNDKIEVTEL